MSNPLAPSLLSLFFFLILDFFLGDPHYRFHPIRVIGFTIERFEKMLFFLKLNGYLGGVILFVSINVIFLFLYWMAAQVLMEISAVILFVFSSYLAFSLFAARDLITHGQKVIDATSKSDLPRARWAISRLVSRDTDEMNISQCHRATIESVSENLVDGIISPLFFYFIAGIPGMLFFKIVSTLDSMTGYKNERYLRFGWAGAKMDDVLNYIPSRIGFLLIACYSFFHPKLNGKKAFNTALKQHALVPGPNSGWAESAMAGALSVKLIGPIKNKGILVTTLWVGDEHVSEEIKKTDVELSFQVVVGVTAMFIVFGLTASLLWRMI